MNVAILGYGKVTSALLKLFKSTEFNVIKILEFPEVIDELYDEDAKKLITSDFIEILYNERIDLIIECFENRTFSYNYVKEALKKKKHFILTNLKLLFDNNDNDLSTLIEIAKEKNVHFSYQAVYPCNNGLFSLIDNVNDLGKFDLIEGTLSPIANYLIGLMSTGMSYENAKSSIEASNIKSESTEYELSGRYSKDLINLLCNFSLKTKIDSSKIYVYPLVNLDNSDITYAKESGYTFKYLSYCSFSQSKLNIICEPVLVNQNSKFYNFKLDTLVHLNTNLGRNIYLSTDSYNELSVASFILLEAMNILKNRSDLNYEINNDYVINNDIYSKYYIHFNNEIKGTTERISRKELANMLNDVKFYARIID